jgi:putative nucleotidyltransferase with HDIG domain
LAIGVVAVVLGVTVVGSISESWVDEQAGGIAMEATGFLSQRASDLSRMAGLAARDQVLEEAVASGDPGRIAARLAVLRSVLGGDAMIVLDERGRTIAAVGDALLSPGDQALPQDATAYARIGMAYATFAQIGGAEYLCSLNPVRSRDYRAMTLVMCHALDDEMLSALLPARGGGVALIGSKGTTLAVRVSPDSEHARELRQALRSVASRGVLVERAPWSIALSASRYRASAVHFRLPGDPREAAVWVAGAAPTTIVERVRTSTTILIVLWTIVAIGSLFGLGWFLANRVGTPVAQLAQAVERVASGDYTVDFRVESGNEIAVLSDNLAKMTESLRERTDGLTRKVLELATLYEMSRVLGATLELEVLLDAVLDSTLRIFGADVGFVALIDKDTQELDVRAWRGVHSSGARPVGGGSMAEWVVKEGRPLLFNPPAGDAGHAPRAEPATGSLAAVCVPLHTADGVIGALYVGSSDPAARFTGEDVRLLSTIANHATIAIGNIDLYASLQEAYLSTVRALAAAIDAKDPYTRGHSERVATYALMIAERMGLAAEQVDALEMASYLHDIGKIGISEDILLKPGKLSDEEMGQMRHHPLIGANILKPVSFPWPILPVVRHHHEHYDGGGYPAGLRGEEIPLLARILTVADSYEAMTSDRPYRRGRSTEEAIAELKRCSGSQFDPKVVEAFVDVLQRALQEQAPFEGAAPPVAEEVLPEQEDAALTAVCEGVLAAFRRLAGPRLASNVEREASARMAERGLPYSLRSGRLVASIQGEPAADSLSRVLETLVAAVRDATGEGLTSQFLSEALQQLPPRMRSVARSIADEQLRRSSA